MSCLGKWMTGIRREVAWISPTVAALFLATVAVPHAGVYYHEHAGGERAHVHAEDGSGLAELLADYWNGHDHVHSNRSQTHDPSTEAGRAEPSGAEMARDDGPHTGHWHSQDCFHRAVSPAVFTAQHTEPVQVAPARPEPAPIDPLPRSIRVRGPPPAA